jgi:TonB family protein
MLCNLKEKVLWLILLAVMFGALSPGPGMGAQAQTTRKVVKKMQPVYPAFATQLNLVGTVKLIVQVTPEGKVKSVHITGGNPVLASAAEDAVKQWIFEPAQKETSEAVEVSFARS